jgi:hypothetical protein
MTIKELIDLSTSRINYLNNLRITAIASGDIIQLASLDQELAETQITLSVLLRTQE